MPRLILFGSAAGCDGEEARTPMESRQATEFTNRLAGATSPYLVQHAHNPVDWHEWGPEALEKARREDKPIFLSIGYAACHWCHVMAHESFENEEIATVMNRQFVNIKVDREERPDLDEIYMRATMALNRGHGGWPMSVWLTPELKPFLAGTYFPPTERWGRTGFKELCERIGALWQEHRTALENDAARLTELVAASLAAEVSGGSAITLADLDREAALLAGVFDHERGGISGGGTNKFPPSMTLDLFLRAVRRGGGDERTRAELLHLVELTLERMAHGGIYDHLAGGMHRYSTDADWLVPHFEKMLYDQALVGRIYVDAYQCTEKAFYADVARGIFDYVLADLQAPEGGFYCTRDADSEGVEGKYYVWRKDEILDILGPENGALFCDTYGVSDEGNWVDPHDPTEPKNILHVQADLEAVCKQRGLTCEEGQKRLAMSRAKLLEARGRRVPPGLDDKILTEWNGLMIASLARGGASLGEERYIDAARRAAQFVLDKMVERVKLRRAFRDGRMLDVAFLTDYACFIEGLLELYEATFEKCWLDRAIELNQTVIQEFLDDENGGFFFTPRGHETLIARSKEIRDSATPSGNAVQLMNLLRLSVLLGDEGLREIAERTMRCFSGAVLRQPGAAERYLAAVEFSILGPTEICVIGDRRDPRTQALLRTVRETYLPNRIFVLHDPIYPADNPHSPLAANRTPVDGQPAAYVCRGQVCRPPVTSSEELEKVLRR